MSVHSCGPNCQEPLCVANRRIVEQQKHINTLTNEKLTLQAKVEKLENAPVAYGLAIDIDILQAKVEELEEALDEKETPAAEVYELRKACRIYKELAQEKKAKTLNSVHEQYAELQATAKYYMEKSEKLEAKVEERDKEIERLKDNQNEDT